MHPWFQYFSVGGRFTQLWPCWSFSRGPMGNYMWPHVGHLGCKCRLPSVRLHKRCKTRAAWRAIRAKLRPFHRDHVYCEGSEKDVLDCPYGTYHHCYHFEYASVVCSTRLFTDIRKPSNTDVSDVLLLVIVTQITVIIVWVIIAVAINLYLTRCFRSS